MALEDNLIEFWKRAIAQAELTTLFNGGAGLTYPFPVAGGGAPIFFA